MTPRWVIPLVVVLLIVGLAAIAGWALVLRTSSLGGRTDAQPPELMWDFSAGNSTGVVSWPAGVQGHLWRVDEPAHVTITIPGGKSDRYLVHSFQVRRQDGRVQSVMLGMPCEPAQAAHDRAKRLVHNWGILAAPRTEGASDPLRDLRAWYASHGPGGSGAGLGFCQMIANGLSPRRSVAIRRCYGDKVNGWYVSLIFGGFPDVASPVTRHGRSSRPIETECCPVSFRSS